MACPRYIDGTAGSRIRVLLGGVGSQYLYFLDEDDGVSEWQSRDWTTGCGGLPNNLAKQLNSCSRKGRHITHVSFGMDGQWFVQGEKRDGSGSHSWWGGTTAGPSIKDVMNNKGYNAKVSFGDNNRWVLLHGANGYNFSYGNIHGDLIKRIKRMNSNGKTINFVRLLPRGGYFISDSEGTEWNCSNNSPLSDELKNGGKDAVLDVSVAPDGSWIVIRPNRYIASQGVSGQLKVILSDFYVRHRTRQSQRLNQIEEYHKRKQEEEEMRLLAEKQLKEEEERRIAAEKRAKVEEEERRLAAEKRAKLEEERRQKEEARNRIRVQQDIEDRAAEISAKQISVGKRVTAIGFSHEPGDAIVKKVSVEGIQLQHRHNNTTSNVITIKDPKFISVFNNSETELDEFFLLCMTAKDKYEAAISLYHCKCDGSQCKCTQIFTSNLFLPQSEEDPRTWLLEQRVHIQDYGDGTIVGTKKIGGKERIKVRYDDDSTCYVNKSQLEPRIHARPHLKRIGHIAQFDEYKCNEKIDYKRLQKLAKKLKKDSNERENCKRHLMSLPNSDAAAVSTQLKKLQRCKELEVLVAALLEYVADLPADEMGIVEYEVHYEHKDPAGRGRLFSQGRTVREGDYPRTTTLQGMHKDLRAPLVGKFAHDIDCENSEVRLLCSLAKQLGLEELVPTLFDYRNERETWMSRISTAHGVSTSDAKRLPNIIISGGQYRTWLRKFNKEDCGSYNNGPLARTVKKFVFNLHAEVSALRDKLLLHPRFKWMSIEREKLYGVGRRGGAIDVALMPRIVQSCENEVLGIIHRCFFDQNWNVLAKVFDGLIVEKGDGASMTLESVMKEAEARCLSRGWDIELAEKPLHGMQKEPMETLVEAQEVLAQWQRAFTPAGPANMSRQVSNSMVAFSGFMIT